MSSSRHPDLLASLVVLAVGPNSPSALAPSEFGLVPIVTTDPATFRTLVPTADGVIVEVQHTDPDTAAGLQDALARGLPVLASLADLEAQAGLAAALGVSATERPRPRSHQAWHTAPVNLLVSVAGVLGGPTADAPDNGAQLSLAGPGWLAMRAVSGGSSAAVTRGDTVVVNGWWPPDFAVLDADVDGRSDAVEVLADELRLLLGVLPASPRLTLVGGCPGVQTIEVLGLAAGGDFVVVRSDDLGHLPIPSGPCQGSWLGLGPAGLVSLGRLAADAAGRFEVTITSGPVQCGQYLQVVDLGTCAVTNPL